jgi:hypothetical protein
MRRAQLLGVGLRTLLQEHNQHHLHPSGDIKPPFSIRALKGNPRDPLHPETVLEIVGASADPDSSHLVSFTGEKESTEANYSTHGSNRVSCSYVKLSRVNCSCACQGSRG